MREFNLRIWETEKGKWKVSKTLVGPDGREVTSNTCPDPDAAFKVAGAFMALIGGLAGVSTPTPTPILTPAELGSAVPIPKRA